MISQEDDGGGDAAPPMVTSKKAAQRKASKEAKDKDKDKLSVDVGGGDDDVASVAPSSSLNEFKRKFSNMVLANSDPSYKAKIHEAVEDKIVKQVGTCHLSEQRKGELVVEYGRATVQGYLINIGYSPEQGIPVIAFRRDMSALHILGKLEDRR